MTAQDLESLAGKAHHPLLCRLQRVQLRAVEPTILQLKDGRVWMLIRTQTGWLYESFPRRRGLVEANHRGSARRSPLPG